MYIMYYQFCDREQIFDNILSYLLYIQLLYIHHTCNETTTSFVDYSMQPNVQHMICKALISKMTFHSAIPEDFINMLISRKFDVHFHIVHIHSQNLLSLFLNIHQSIRNFSIKMPTGIPCCFPYACTHPYLPQLESLYDIYSK